MGLEEQIKLEVEGEAMKRSEEERFLDEFRRDLVLSQRQLKETVQEFEDLKKTAGRLATSFRTLDARLEWMKRELILYIERLKTRISKLKEGE